MLAKRSLGQNFLRDQAIIDRIVKELGPVANGTVVEIGPGRGALTENLVQAAGQVFAIEFDRDMVSILRERFSQSRNFTLINADALNFDYSSIVPGELMAKLVANLPYNISTPILQKLAEQRHLFSCLVLMFQREVVDRIMAGPGGKNRGFLSVLMEEAFVTERLFDIPPTAFVPVPKVWSSVVRLKPQPRSDIDHELFRKIVSSSFSQKRKTLLNNLKGLRNDARAMLDTSGIDGTRRAETLTLIEWHALTRAMSSEKIPESGL